MINFSETAGGEQHTNEAPQIKVSTYIYGQGVH